MFAGISSEHFMYMEQKLGPGGWLRLCTEVVELAFHLRSFPCMLALRDNEILIL